MAVDYVSEQVGVQAQDFASYAWTGRTIERHRAEIRTVFGFREFTRADETDLTAWLAAKVCPSEVRESALVAAVLGHCRQDKIEPPGRLSRMIGAARAMFEQDFSTNVLSRLGPAGMARLDALVADGTSGSLLTVLKADKVSRCGKAVLPHVVPEAGTFD